MTNGGVNINIVGHTPYEVALLVPGLLERDKRITKQTRVLIGAASVVGDAEPWSHEKLSPLLGLYRESCCLRPASSHPRPLTLPSACSLPSV